ncbi:MAG: glycoside hydrolase family 99-like domain-containing protein [Mangrovibacterium sp.]
MKNKIYISIVFFLSVTEFLIAQTTQNIQQKKYDIAAYFWPAYYPDDRAKIFWPEGTGEWETILNNPPKFTGHDQPRKPVWGQVNEADRYVMEMEIAAAADHGVNVFIFDWYWYDSMPFLEDCLNEGYLKARNNDRVKFYLMWANHDVGLGWDKRNADDAFTRKNKALVWKAGIDRQEFEKIARRWIEKYFSQPTYYKIDGKPVFMFYELHTFVQGLGGVEQAKDALAWFRAEVKKAGFPGLVVQLSLRGDRNRSLSVVASDNIGTQREVVEKVGFDLLTHYQWVHWGVNVNRDYNEILKDIEPRWETLSKEFTAYYCPNVTIGWDSSPRTIRRVGDIITNNTPANFEKALRAAKAFVDAHPNQPPLITINSWNEWSESSYLEPDTERGYGYLEAVKNVFVSND